MRPGCLGREIFLERGEHGIAALAIGLDELLQRALPRRVREVVLNHDLVKRRAAQVGALLHQADASEHVNRRANPADAKARREDLRDGAQVDDAIVLRLQRDHVPTFVAQTAVGVVLDDHEVVLMRELDETFAALACHSDAAGVLEVGNGVEHLQALVSLADALELLFQQIHAHALVVERHGVNLGLVGVECGKRR